MISRESSSNLASFDLTAFQFAIAARMASN